METFRSALHGDGTRLRSVTGPDDLVCVAHEPHSVFLVQNAADGTQSATIGSCGLVAEVGLPPSFRVVEIAADGAEFVVTSADGRVAHGTPDQFTAFPKLVAQEHNPRYAAQLEELFLQTHLLTDEPLDTPFPPVATDERLAEPEVLRFGEALVTVGGREVWLSFDNARPDRVAELLPHTRALLADVDRLSRAGAELLWARVGEGDEAEFLAAMTATSLVVYLTGDFELHYEEVSGTYWMDGYWPSVQFLADRTAVDFTTEA
jgi:hypothetical protein